MKDKLNIIKINGITGIILAVFLIGCFIEGVIIFPSKILMYLWNYFSTFFINMPKMELLHGCMLWAIIALSGFALMKGKCPISYSSNHTNIMSEEEFRNIIMKSSALKNVNDISEEIKDIVEISNTAKNLTEQEQEEENKIK